MKEVSVNVCIIHFGNNVGNIHFMWKVPDYSYEAFSPYHDSSTTPGIFTIKQTEGITQNQVKLWSPPPLSCWVQLCDSSSSSRLLKLSSSTFAWCLSSRLESYRKFTLVVEYGCSIVQNCLTWIMNFTCIFEWEWCMWFWPGLKRSHAWFQGHFLHFEHRAFTCSQRSHTDIALAMSVSYLAMMFVIYRIIKLYWPNHI